MLLKKRAKSSLLHIEALETRRLLTAEIEGFVWNDWNQNGRRGDRDVEYRVADVTVNLLSEHLELVDSVKTDRNGEFQFDSINPGGYALEFIPPDGTRFTQPFWAEANKDSDVDPETGRTATFHLSEGDTIDTIDAGIYSQAGAANVEGRVWHDLNGDGIMQADEPPLPNSEVQLENLHGERLLEVETDDDGRYLIPGEQILPGDFVVDFVRPSSDEPRWQLSPQNVRETDALDDSDAGIIDGRSDVFAVPGHDVTEARGTVNLSAGFFRSETISGFVWHDLNGDGLGSFGRTDRQPAVDNIDGEFGASGIAVRLLQGDLQVAETETNRYGHYSLVVPGQGDYQIEFVAPDGVDFRARREGTDSLVDASGRGTVSVGRLQQVTGFNAGVYSQHGTPSITGRVWHDANANGFQDPDEVGLENVEVQIENNRFVELARTVSGPNGVFEFSGSTLLPGSYHLDFKRPGRNGGARWQIGPRNDGHPDTSLDNDAQPTNGKTPPIRLAPSRGDQPREAIERDAAFFRYATLDGEAWNDANANGNREADEVALPGLRVQLLDANNGVMATTFTDAQGRYLFDELVPGVSYATAFHAPDDARLIVANHGEQNRIQVDPATGRSDAFMPDSTDAYWGSVGLLGRSDTAAVSGFAWDDLDGNGLFDPGEPRQAGVQVNLRRSNETLVASAITDVDGHFAFDELSPSGYMVEFVPPDGSTISPMNRGNDDSIDSDANRFSLRTGVFPVAAGQVESSLGVGIYRGEISSNTKDALRVTEVGFIGHGNAEFTEVKNIGDQPIDLSGVRFTSGIRFDFNASLTRSLFPGEHAIIVGDISLLSNADNNVNERFDLQQVNVAGIYQGDLNREERITLKDAFDEVITSFRYDDDWFILMDDEYEAWTLTVVDESANVTDWESRSNWRPSSFLAGTPGFDDPKITPDPGAVVVNEVLSNPSDGFNDLVEIHNTTNQDIDIGYWYLGDSGNREVEPLIKRTRYRIAPNTILPAHGYLVFSRDEHFGNSADPGVNYPFGLSSHGEALHIIAADRFSKMMGYSDTAAFPASQADVSFGRHVLSDGSTAFTQLESPTFGDANSKPVVNDVIIDAILHTTEGIHAHEFVRIFNTSDVDVVLFDAEGPWSIGGGITFQFDDDARLRPQQRAYIVPIDPQEFRQTYQVPSEIEVFGPYSESLNGRGEEVALMRTGDDGRNLIVDYVAFDDGLSWPARAREGNTALLRNSPDVLGSDPSNWTASGIDVQDDRFFVKSFAQTSSAAVYGHDVLGQYVFRAISGDANGDGTFDSRDLVQVFVAGQYNDRVVGNSSWSSGDWTGDQEFDSRDLVTAFSLGGYSVAAAVQGHGNRTHQAVERPLAIDTLAISSVLEKLESMHGKRRKRHELRDPILHSFASAIADDDRW